jgi:DNA polymerase-3 subunit delta
VQVKPADLPRRLGAGLAPAYLVSGDESLLVQEACDAVLTAARAQGYTERSIIHAEQGFNWNDVVQDASSMSLFAERRVVDVRVPSGKFDREASEVLRAYAGHPAEDTLLLIRTVRLDPRQRQSAWFKALDSLGVVVLVWPIGVAELPRWLDGRLRAAGLGLDRNALACLAERVEGNLLAAVQEIEKLKLAGLPEPISAENLLTVLEDAAHYNAFELIDSTMAGDPARVSRILVSLREEGVALFAILGALTSQLRRVASGDRLPPQRQRLVSSLQRRLGLETGIPRVLAECALIDAQGKGQLVGDAWLSLEKLLLGLSGLEGYPPSTGLDPLR